LRQTITNLADPVDEPTLAASLLARVLDRVEDAVILHTDGQATLNEAARELLAVPKELEYHPSLVRPRALDGSAIDLDPQDPYGDSAPEGGASFRVRVTALDGRELVIDGTLSPLPNGSVYVFRDVTSEHERNQLNQQTLNALFDTLPVAISVADPETHELRAVNRAFAELVGLPVEAIVGLRPPFPWWDDHDTSERAFAAGTKLERVYRRPDGRPRPVELSIHDVRDDKGDVVLELGVTTDVSDERRLQQQLVQSGKLAAIGELAAGVAHEINNPLFAILGLTEFLLKEAAPGSKAHQRLELIQSTGLEIKEIVRALLDFARENADERQVVPLADVVRSTVDLVRRTNAHKGVELVDTYGDEEAPVAGSPNQLKQILLNLIANARQAMPNGGTVHVDVRRDRGAAVVSVADDGPGITPELAPRIFEPFFTTKRATGGTGLGLSVSLGIAEAHGGTLTACSEAGRGATFTLRLPLAEDG
jgi:two-component system NtrC family sensor kinase